MPRPTLDEILHSTEDQDLELNGLAEESDAEEVVEGICVECKDQQSQLYCEQCQEDFCQVCSDMIHRTGTRRAHSRKVLDHQEGPTIESKMDGQKQKPEEAEEEPSEPLARFGESTRPVENFSEWIKQRSKYIPLRLTLRERKYLRLLEAALNVSEYTDRVDILMYGNKSKRMVSQIKELCAILSGLVLASDYKVGQSLFETKEFAENEGFYQKIFEIGRRHKIMNPEKMRDQYGKMMFLLQDSQAQEVSQMLGFELVTPIKTVYSVLESLGVEYLLEDEMVEVATREILSGGGKSRGQVELEKKQKERAVEYLAKAYATQDCPAEVIRQCLYSIGDNHAYLRFARDACDRMSEYLERYFDPVQGGELAILYGKQGARLSHSHGQQYQYVRQTLRLWREIQHEMFMLWYQADQDLLAARNAYRLKDTGQGLNRVQSCPRVSKTSHAILNRTQKALGRWVGSAMIHLGDRNVPNALVFIDKYNQVPSILNPVVRAVEYLEALGDESGELRLVADMYGGREEAVRAVLGDFFRSAFDGSGADNFFDAGSCIDGRLTSAWNWCSQVEKKPFFNLFLLSGFVGFN